VYRGPKAEVHRFKADSARRDSAGRDTTGTP
jgi:hypothetical protein